MDGTEVEVMVSGGGSDCVGGEWRWLWLGVAEVEVVVWIYGCDGGGCKQRWQV